MTQAAQASVAENPKSSSRLMILLAMAMFVLVVDTSHHERLDLGGGRRTWVPR